MSKGLLVFAMDGARGAAIVCVAWCITSANLSHHFSEPFGMVRCWEVGFVSSYALLSGWKVRMYRMGLWFTETMVQINLLMGAV